MTRRSVFKERSPSFMIKFRCPKCGSSAIGTTTQVYWEERRGYWSMPPVFEVSEECWCCDCEEVFDIEQAKEAAEKARNQDE